ncbi:hypothetical protein PhaeoP18_04163 (plasmid) [Phaeobacter piscinae]|uniref:hypothetical protein n=1 Tax=Phaeobacter piscinae TaxID=1580596 RepID=UPI000C9C90DF|nr:hypothetical protein [Phaeobacter piscinae]AUR38379.1 hypothetical protein PhaeoP18_04163 [Phaeobacter piscinae]
MKISALIAQLQLEQQKHGDLPIFTVDSDIGRIHVIPCKDGISRTTNGKPEEPNELVLEFHPAD